MKEGGRLSGVITDGINSIANKCLVFGSLEALKS